MQVVGKFSKVSYDEFAKAIRSEVDAITEDAIIDIYNTIKLPKRATTGSAGYDFFSPIWFELHPGESIKVPTGVNVDIADGWFLGCVPRSGLGFKYRAQLDNTIGVIDSDYIFSDNEGHIWAKITNDSKSDKVLTVNKGDAFMQGIFIQYGVTTDDKTTGIRNGGFGSTGGAQ